MWIQKELNLPIPLIKVTHSLELTCIWDLFLFIGFGVIHSLFAQRWVHQILAKVLPPQLIRTFYLCLTGLSLTFVMWVWQPTHVMIWRLAPDSHFVRYASLGGFWAVMAFAGYLLSQFGILEFLGINQLGMKGSEFIRTEGVNQLNTKGIYRFVRHPVYSLTLLAIFIAANMSLDRMLIGLSTLLYLRFGIPIEEKKLIHQFGEDYENYRKKVPSLIPLFRTWKV